MDNKYKWRSALNTSFSTESKSTIAKVVMKTIETNWVATDSPVIIPISIHSSIHEGVKGDLKMEALVSLIRKNVSGRVTILFGECAHLNAVSLLHQNKLDLAFENCLTDAKNLEKRYQSFFDGCQIVYWYNYIKNNAYYLEISHELNELYLSDLKFRDQVYKDALDAYSPAHRERYPNKTLFIEKTIEDILEQSIGFLLLARIGYRFLFYPGAFFESWKYLMQIYADTALIHINANICIYKKDVCLSPS